MSDSGPVGEPAGDARASWHPAFRPNSHADITPSAPPAEEPIQEEQNVAVVPQAGPEPVRVADVELQEPLSSAAGDEGTAKIAGSEQHASIPSADDQSLSAQTLSESRQNGLSDPADAFSTEPALIQHTNSFPPVPPLAESSAIPSHPLPQSQAEAIIEEEESGLKGTLPTRQDSWGGPANSFSNDDANFFSGADQPEPTDAEARFEEGIPLVSEQPSHTGFEERSNIGKEPFSPGFGDSATKDDFFNNLGAPQPKEPAEPENPTLDRKSTEQVLSSFAMSAPSARPSTLEETTSRDLANSTGNGIAVSTTTVASQVLADTLAAKESPLPDTKPAVKDEDLTALWEAALGDDELLDENSSLDPSTFFDDDGEGFLEDEPAPVPTPVHDASGALKGFDSLSRPIANNSIQPASQSRAPSSRYAPASTPSSGPQPMQNRPMSAAQAPSQFPNHGPAVPPAPAANANVVSTPQSFSDKAKGGYSSPYDAPIDLSRPKRRSVAPMQQTGTQGGTSTQPPPRSSSITSTGSSTGPSGGQPPKASQPATFFEELPIAPKVRPQSTIGRMTAPAPGTQPPPPSAMPSQPMPPPSQQFAAPPPPKPMAPPVSNYGLVAPERKMSFTDGSQQMPQIPAIPQSGQPSRTAPPAANNRYSPAPASQTMQQQPAAASNRYAAPPGSGPPSSGPPRQSSISSMPYQPRTSSPLAQHNTASQSQHAASHSGPPLSASSRPPSISSPSSAYHPKQQQSPPSHLAHGIDPSAIERPNVTQRGIVHEPSSAARPSRIRQGPSIPDDANFVPPTNGLENDPLKRWQGSPIVRFGFGGAVATSFPKRLPRYVAGQTAPSIVCAPGQVSVQTPKFLPLPDIITSFPGPLKGKGKKKDVLQWLDKGIEQLERDLAQGNVPPALLSPPKRYEERILLWRILRTLVEYDGNIENNPVAVTAVRGILSPELKRAESGPDMYGAGYQPSGIVSRSGAPQSVNAGADAVEQIRKLLLNGEREKAVWHAADQRLWGHAMLLASTLSREVWKQVAQEFVKNDVKTVGDNVEPLAALYDIFAGNWEESVDQLVPSSARAGLQMVSKTAGGGPAKNAIEGLNHWRETLSLVLGNRSAEDVKSLSALGQLLASYGRVEAAHICYIFARLPGLFSGADDPQAAIVLLSEDHRANPSGYASNLTSVLLTEVFEFATCVLATPTAPSFAYLQSFKLWHATMLAECGVGDQAQQYCDTITVAIKGSTKASPYYHPQLFAATEDLLDRLKSTPREGGSWMSKPNMDKVSGSVWNKFTQFVAGDDSDATSQTSKAEVEGPFSRISGDTPPSISRGPSPSDHYGQYGGPNGYAPTSQAPATNSRYAPKGNFGPQTAGEIKKQPSYASISSVSTSGQGPRSYQVPPKSASLSGGAPGAAANRYSPVPSHASGTEDNAHVGAPMSPQRDLQADPAAPPTSSPTLYPGGTGPTFQPAAPPPPRGASPYEPRRTESSQAPSSYAPRPQPSPLGLKPEGAEPLQPSALPYEASGSPSQAAMAGTPTISHVPPTPTAPVSNSEHLNDAGPYGAPASGAATPSSAASAGGYEPPSYQPPSAGYQPPSAGFAPPADEPERSTGGYEPPTAEAAQSSGGYEPPNYGASAGGYEPPTANAAQSSGGYEPPSHSYEPPSNSYEPPSAGYAPPSAGYAPPSAGYAPPSAGYAPPIESPTGAPAAQANGETTQLPPKKSMMDLDDDDDDLVARAAALKKSQQSDADRQADDAFRKAAEADAARDKAKTVKGKSSGWLGGWFSRSGAGSDSDTSLDKKPIKARLGEENSFYYDPELKKWVNKKAGADEQAAAAAPTPPPPKGPPRGASPLAGPPMGGPPTSHPTPPMGPTGAAGPPPPPGAAASRGASPARPPAAGGTGPPPPAAAAAAASDAPAGITPGLAPPSRPSTGMSNLSNASDIDDLLPTEGRRGGTMRKKKARGYVDVMAK